MGREKSRKEIQGTGVAVFVPWIERSRLLPLPPLFPFNLDLQRVLSLIDGFLALNFCFLVIRVRLLLTSVSSF